MGVGGVDKEGRWVSGRTVGPQPRAGRIHLEECCTWTFLKTGSHYVALSGLELAM